MDDVVMPWAFGGIRMALDYSLTHSLTHSILINLFIKVRLNTLLLPPLPVREYASFGRTENNGLRHQP